MKKQRLCVLVVGPLGLVLIGGCHSRSSTSSNSTTPQNRNVAVVVPKPTDEQLRNAKVNENGVVPILEYHDIASAENSAKFARGIVNFRKDLFRLYSEGYRPVSLHDYLDNKIGTPIGTSPVVFTFDDARESQFRYLANGDLDPDCAVGILQDFQKTHPDFTVKATFYILAERKFGQAALAAKKIRTLLEMGCEIGNHTVTHRALASLSDEEVVQELGKAVELAKGIDAEVNMETIALPLGSWPHNRALLASGNYKGTAYANRAVLKVGAGPALSPTAVNFNPMSLPRIQASEEMFGITYWLDSLKRHPERRYVSDGDPETVTVPKMAEKGVAISGLKGAVLRTY